MQYFSIKIILFGNIFDIALVQATMMGIKVGRLNNIMKIETHFLKMFSDFSCFSQMKLQFFFLVRNHEDHLSLYSRPKKRGNMS